MFGGSEWLIVILIILLLIGGPNLVRNFAGKAGKNIRKIQDVVGSLAQEIIGVKTNIIKATQESLVNSADPLRVFVCSMQDEMALERAKVCAYLEKWGKELGLTRPFLFEQSPASPDTPEEVYREAIERCDFFVIFVAEDISVPVLKEYQFAIEYKKPCLVFKKDTPNQSEQVRRFLADVTETWSLYEKPDDLAVKVSWAIATTLVNDFRRHRLSSSDTKILLLFLQSFGVEEAIRLNIFKKLNETMGSAATQLKDGVAKAIEERKAAAEKERKEREAAAEKERKEREAAAEKERKEREVAIEKEYGSWSDKEM